LGTAPVATAGEELLGTTASVVRALFEDFFEWVNANPYGWRILFHDAPADAETATALARARRLAAGQIASFLALAPELHTHTPRRTGR
jgi:hypothetical protein